MRLIPFLQKHYMEIDQQSDREIQEAKVRKQLRFINRMQSFFAFQFYD